MAPAGSGARDRGARLAHAVLIEADLTAAPPPQVTPLLDELRAWLTGALARVPARGDLAAAIRYALSRWEALTRYAADGRLEADNNPVERAIRPLAIGRKNWLFAGSDAGGHHAAAVASRSQAPSSTASTRKPIYAACWSASPTTPWAAWPSCCPGTCAKNPAAAPPDGRLHRHRTLTELRRALAALRRLARDTRRRDG
jgi:hypothetical protein